MMNNPLDLPLFLQVSDSYTGQTPIDLQSFNEDTLADETEGRHFFDNTVERGLVK